MPHQTGWSPQWWGMLWLALRRETHEATILCELGHGWPRRAVLRDQREPGSGGEVSDAERILRAAADVQDRQPGGFFLRSAHVPGGRADRRGPRPRERCRGGQRRLPPPGLHGGVFPER